MTKPTKPMREAMPTVAAWIDELREVFGADGINASIKNGMAGGSDFYAEENGHMLGSDAAGGCVVSLADMILAKSEKEDDGRSR